ncbi:MAG TPA: hypothetical protein QF753_10160 [Victivallales bacterium]|nr:hypothetical protein [Victivallales bacterium]
MIKEIRHNNNILAIIIKSNYSKDCVSFFTPDSFSQQLAYMNHNKGKIISAHRHNLVKREVKYTQEVLVIKSGKLKVNFYDDEENYLESHVLGKGDVILLAAGGHGFEVLEDLEMYEVKQGPYSADKDKVRFKGIEGQ